MRKPQHMTGPKRLGDTLKSTRHSNSHADVGSRAGDRQAGSDGAAPRGGKRRQLRHQGAAAQAQSARRPARRQQRESPSRHVTSLHVALRCVTSRHVTSRRVPLHRVASCRVARAGGPPAVPGGYSCCHVSLCRSAMVQIEQNSRQNRADEGSTLLHHREM